MQWWQIVLTAAVSYLLGSVNGAIIVSQGFHKVDIRDFGSGNAGTTNALRVMGKKWTMLVIALDLLKGALAVTFGFFLFAAGGDGNFGKLLAGLFAIVGHIFPVYFKFKGGKGVMTTAAIIAFVDWRVFLIVMSLFVIVVAITRWVSLGSILSALGVPVGMYFFHMGQGRETFVFVALSALITLMIVVMHRDNISRIFAGTERRFSFKGRAVLDTVKTKTADIKHKTTTVIKDKTHRLHSKASNMNDRRKKRRSSKKKLRKSRRMGTKRRHVNERIRSGKQRRPRQKKRPQMN